MDSRDAARLLHDWVHDHMEPADTDVRFKTSLEVLEDLRGTCSEYTVLFAALSRAAGIPARVSVGFALSAAGELVPHIWPQVFVGRWVEVDPSWNAFPVEAAHVKTGQGLLHPAHLERLNPPLELIAAGAGEGLRLVRYDAAGQPPCLAAAESLHNRRPGGGAPLRGRRGPRPPATSWPPCPSTAAAARPSPRPPASTSTGDNSRRRPGPSTAWRASTREPKTPCSTTGRGSTGSAADPAGERGLLEELAERFPESDLADDGLGRLAGLVEESEGCRRARPLYRRLAEAYAGSGWASVAASALRRCAEREALLREPAPEADD